MNSRIKCAPLRTLLLLLLSFLPDDREVNAQTLKTVYQFTGNDGDTPLAGLIMAGNTLYGTTSVGSGGYGNVFRVTTNGTGFTNLYSFSTFFGQLGEYPDSRLTLADSILYGTTPQTSIPFSEGVLFNLKVDGSSYGNQTGYGNLYVFSGAFGRRPSGPLSLSVDPQYGTTLYGTTSAGGDFDKGIVFFFNGSVIPLHHFNLSDGGMPSGVLLSGNTLYGTTKLGGSLGRGTVYAMNIDGTGFRILYNFGTPTNTEGVYPNAGLTLSGNSLYGTALIGGTAGQGTVFKVNIDGSGFAVLHTFTGTNSDGVNPNGEMTLSSNMLYGTTTFGGPSGYGTVFKVGTDGSGFATLHSFTGRTDGANPNGGLVIAGNVLYGTTSGNRSGYGTVFSLSDSPPMPVPPRLTTSRSGPNVILEWPTSLNGFSYAGYSLQSTTDLGSPVWTTNLPAPVIVNGQYTVTNPISGTQQFFRLSQ